MNRVRKALAVATLGAAMAVACVDIIGIKDVPDGAVDDSAVLESGDDGGTGDAACDPAAPFGPSTIVGGISSEGVYSITLSPDQLTAYICHATANVGDPMFLSFATRTSPTASFGSETPIPTDQKTCFVTTSLDNRTMVWTHFDPPDSSSFPPEHLFISTRADTSHPFVLDGGTALSGLNVRSEGEPYLRADGTKLYYFEDPGNTSLLSKYAVADSGFQVAAALVGLPSTTYTIAVSSDDLLAYFNMPQMEVATRASATDPFGGATLVKLPDAGAYAQTTPRLITDDRCTFYYTANTPNPVVDGSQTFSTVLYVAKKTP